MKARIFRFVRHENAQTYIDLGWERHDGLIGTHHGYHATILEWTGEEPPREPTEIALAS